MKKIALFFLLASSILILSACSLSNSTASGKANLEKTVSYLTSDSLGGRLVGSEGNLKAGAHIKSSFEAMGLTPFEGDDFGISYFRTDVYSPEDCAFELELQIAGEWFALELGKDFQPRMSYNGVEGEFELDSSSVRDGSSSSAALIARTEDFAALEVLPTIALIKAESIDAYPEGADCIGLTSNAYKKAAAASRIRVKIDTPLYSTDVENVVGLIPGLDSNSAVVVSAHFDYLGQVGNVVYSGDRNNVSGSALMLDMAKILSSGEKPPVDIVFCALNGEESSRQGSKALVESISSRYDTFWALNIDNVGSAAGGSQYMIDSKPDDPLAAALFFSLEESDFSAKPGSISAAHTTFARAGFSSMAIGQAADSVSVADSVNTLDYEEMALLSKLLCDFVLTYADSASVEFFAEDAVPLSAAPNALAARRDEILDGREPAYDEVVYFEHNGSYYQATGARLLTDISEVNYYHGNLNIPESFAGLPLEFVIFTPGIISAVPYGSELNSPESCYNFIPSTLNTVLRRSFDTDYLNNTNSSSLYIRYREGSRTITLRQYNSGLWGVVGESAAMERLTGEYSDFTLAVTNPNYIRTVICNYPEINCAISIEIADIDYENSTGGAAPVTRYMDLGNNTREDILEIVALFKQEFAQSGLVVR